MIDATIAVLWPDRKGGLFVLRGKQIAALHVLLALPVLVVACVLLMGSAGCIPASPGVGWSPDSKQVAVWRLSQVAAAKNQKPIVDLVFCDLAKKQHLRAARMVTTGGDVTLSRPVWSPDQKTLAWVQWYALDGKAENKSVLRVWMASAAGSKPRILAEFDYPMCSNPKKEECPPATMLTPCWSTNGKVLYVSGTQGTYSVPLDGSAPSLIVKTLLLNMAVGPDGNVLAGITLGEYSACPSGGARDSGGHRKTESGLDFSKEKGLTRLVFVNLRTRRPTEVTSFAERGESVIGLAWLSKDQVVVGVMKEMGDGAMWTVSVSGVANPLRGFNKGAVLPAVSPDGRYISYVRLMKVKSSLSTELRLLDLKSRKDRLLYSSAREQLILWPQWSPNGKWIGIREVSLAARDNRKQPKTLLVPLEGKPVPLEAPELRGQTY